MEHKRLIWFMYDSLRSHSLIYTWIVVQIQI